MNTLLIIIQRNIKLYFKDKGMFISSLITPMILLVLYVTFLGKVYKDSFSAAFPEGFSLKEEIINGAVGGQLLSSLLAVCCITVAFCSNFVMVQDKVTGAEKDLSVSPLKPSVLAVGYYIATFLSSFIICLIAAAAGLAYIAAVGWYISVSDILLIIFDVFILTMFGTALSSVINFFLSTEGQISAVGKVISAGYGFICGAYMPISQFGSALRKVLGFFPGTYGTSLIRNHTMRGVLSEMSAEGVPEQVIEAVKDSIDCNIYFFDTKVGIPYKYAVLSAAILVLVAVFVLLNAVKGKKTSA